MLINNETGQTIVLEVKIADTKLSRTLGLMGKSEFHRKVLVIKNCSQVHTFFMRFPIDILFVSEKGVVIHKVIGLKPWRVTKKVNHSSYVIEATSGSFTSQINVGDKVSFQKSEEKTW
ncbi:DUF192 domain-containing protein [Alteribacter populi]|uniref:DUF192 domain-containing protein n=1 Tax=Alteribacter populi TaxID=2011011 RepID=UPI000BBA8EBC|nr:DUF192 domain-containing protein [Alteribacter populi]